MSETGNGTIKLIEPMYQILILPKGEIVNHERWSNQVFERDYRTFNLFWTSLGNESYYGGNLLRYRFRTSSALTGINLLVTPSDLEDAIGFRLSYGLDECSDAFKDLWYGILEHDVLGFRVDFIKLYDREIIFSLRNLHLLEILEITQPEIRT